MKVVEWISDDEVGDRKESVGGMGGWFDGHTWQDYLDAWKPEVRPYFEAIRESVVTTGHWINGKQHQNADDGVPLFEDGTVGQFSFRAWGDLMAAISESVDHGKWNYMNWYYCVSPDHIPVAKESERATKHRKW